jgi:microcystin-dependent protein
VSEPFLGSIVLFAGNFPPRGWAFCNGQILSISQNTALFSILGTTYGGNGVTTFALPDLRGRAPIHFGQGPGLTNYVLGENGGVEDVTLVETQLPAHTHAQPTTQGQQTTNRPSNRGTSPSGRHSSTSRCAQRGASGRRPIPARRMSCSCSTVSPSAGYGRPGSRTRACSST